MADKTDLLYYKDPYQIDFTANVFSVKSVKDNKWDVVLDRTCFYPEGGGQPSAFGEIDGIKVDYVYKKDGEIFHSITVGFGIMGAHGGMIRQEDRWKIILHIRENLQKQMP